MEYNEDYITELSELKFDEFDKRVELLILNKSDEEKLALLRMIKRSLKEAKSYLSVVRKFTTDEEEKFILKNQIKKLKKKIFLVNYKTRQVNPTTEKISRKGMLSGKQKRIRNDIFNEEDISKYSIKDQIVTLNYLIVEDFSEENRDLIEKYSHEICINLDTYLEKNDEFKEFRKFLDDLKTRITRCEKDTDERAILKKIYNNFKDVCQLYKLRKKEENVKVNTNSAFYDVINYWMNAEENYNFIKALLERKDKVVNTRYNGKHIVFYILESYIHNFKRMVNDKNSDYLNLKYIEEVYYLFTKNPALSLSKEERELVDVKIEEFEKYIDTTLIKQKRKNHAKSVCEKMKSRNFYNSISYYSFPDYSDDELGWFQVSITNSINNQIKNEECKDAYIYDDRVYNLRTNEDGKIILNIYAIAFHNYIVRESEVDKYLERCEILKEEVDPFFKKELVFQSGYKYPAINYELEFYPSGKFCSLKVKEENINVKPITSEKLEELESLYKKSAIKNNDLENALNAHFENILQRAYVDFIEDKHYPYIYYGKTEPSSVEIDKTINDLSSDLYDMEKSDYAEIINIISNEVDIYHYTLMPIRNAKYELNLLNPISYLGIENQRMIADFHFNRRRFTNKERLHSMKVVYMQHYCKKVEELNANLGYVDSDVIKQKRGRIKNRLRI